MPQKMKVILSILTLIVLTLQSPVESSSNIFCYLDPTCDPYSPLWPGACKNGVNQSPINLPYSILTSQPISKSAYKSNVTSSPRELTFNPEYKSFTEFYIQDNGHTVQVSLTSNLTSPAQLIGFGLDRPYSLAQVHFHWGANNSEGSEHTLNHLHYPMEIHMVHYNTKYPSFPAAVAAKDSKSLAVVAIFLTIGEETDVNQPFDLIASVLPLDFQEKPAKISKSLDLSKFLPSTGQTFYRYLGSLTTPNCTEDVIWTVITEPIRVKPSEVDKFRKVRDHGNSFLGENFRPIQPLNNRMLEFMHIKSVETNISSGSKVFGNLLLCLAVFLLFW